MHDRIANLVRRMPWTGAVADGTPESASLSPLLTREWLVTNGLGGYACGTIAGAATRRYHLPLSGHPPLPRGRQVCSITPVFRSFSILKRWRLPRATDSE